MGCERYREIISARLDGETDPADDTRTDRHLARCADCRGTVTLNTPPATCG
jgi:predicted anti-sigma-YlaC factor YlaD